MGSFKTIGRPGIGGQKSSWKTYSFSKFQADINFNGLPTPITIWRDEDEAGDEGIIPFSELDPATGQKIFVKSTYFCLEMDSPDSGSSFRVEINFRRAGTNNYEQGEYIDPSVCNGRCCSRFGGVYGSHFTLFDGGMESITLSAGFTTGSTPEADAELGFIVMVSPK